tara:strand:+ start:86 stop:484 length:399 start_codon:yes stop_codon:yes gene_type:complete
MKIRKSVLQEVIKEVLAEAPGLNVTKGKKRSGGALGGSVQKGAGLNVTPGKRKSTGQLGARPEKASVKAAAHGPNGLSGSIEKIDAAVQKLTAGGSIDATAGKEINKHASQIIKAYRQGLRRQEAKWKKTGK